VNNDPPHPDAFSLSRLKLPLAAPDLRAASYQQLLKPAGYRRLPVATVAMRSRLRRGGRESAAMKIFAVAAVMLALVAVPASAQMNKRPKTDDQKSEQKKPVVDDKAYKAALERIPEPKEKYDPWGVARPAEPAKKPK
jgi:hypothetical protein